MQKILLSLTGTLSLLVFFNKSYAQPNGGLVADKIIAVVGNKVVLKSDIENAVLDMKRQGAEIPADAGCYLLEQAISIKALVLSLRHI